MKKRILLYVVCFVVSVSCFAQQLAFPGADGFGRFSIGGRGGVVYYVTNLNDDTNPGSLRYGLTKLSGPRTILFKVSGLIQLKSELKITNGNVTIAGQSAPGDGICLSNYTLRVLASDVIVRYIRSRLGDVTSYIDDAMDGNGSVPVKFNNIIIDHCTMSWSIDEVGSFYNNKNFTMQWCVLSESLYHSVDPKGNHGYAGIWGGQNASFHHNLLAHNSSRNPRFCGSRYTGDSINEIVDMRNNVIYNWGNINSAYGGEGGNHNIVNNYFKPGPATPGSTTTSSTSNKRNRILNYTSYYYASDAYIYPDTVWGGKFYVNGNFVEGYPDVTADNWTRGVQPDSYVNVAVLMAKAKQATPFAFSMIRTQTATEAFASVLDSAGCTLPRRDTIDRRITKETRTGTATYEGGGYITVSGTGISHPSGIIDSQKDVGGWPAYNSDTPPTDTDADGMPDWWENMNGLNPNNPSDGNSVALDGYTMLEKYLNAIPSSDAQVRFTSVAASKNSNTSSTINFTIDWAKNGFTFGLFRSSDSINFVKIAEINSSTNKYQYSIDDAVMPSKTNYYRIASYAAGRTDTILSSIVKIDNSIVTAVNNPIPNNNVLGVTLYPNPAGPNITVRFLQLQDNGVIRIITSNGKTIKQITVPGGAAEKFIAISDLPAGVYFVELLAGKKTTTTSFIKR
jgi:hypothetical protein